ncbi:MAG: M67 family metallopeptidase, partial [Acidimicrobiia bacterium]
MQVPGQIYDAILNHAEACAPEEACGLLAADAVGALRMVYCLTNVQHSTAAYTIDPEEHFKAMRHAEANGWHLAGAFHSHPDAEPYPSATDRALATEPDWVYMIAGKGRKVR